MRLLAERAIRTGIVAAIQFTAIIDTLDGK
jgi:hypothetical protein